MRFLFILFYFCFFLRFKTTALFHVPMAFGLRVVRTLTNPRLLREKSTVGKRVPPTLSQRVAGCDFSFGF